MPERTVSGILLISLLMSVFFLTWGIHEQSRSLQGFAHVGALSAWASETPLIDGMLRPAVDFLGLPAEWEDASKMEFDLFWGLEHHEAAVYVMNDYINLYLAFEIHGEDLSGSDKVTFNFDNDNDGFKETSDDSLFVEGSNRFHDAFFAGLSYCDVEWGGTLDGVGASMFTPRPDTTNVSYGFEIAHPLNTSDNGFDFSLDIGDTVGFNVLFFDGGGVIGGGWPTFTQEDWSQMADIVIAGPPESPPQPSINLKIRKIEITQAIQWLDDTEHEDNSVRLARGKSTVVRVYLETEGYSYQLRGVSVYLYAFDGSSGVSLVDPGLWSSAGPLDTIFDAPVAADRGNGNHTANFLLPPYWVDRGTLTLAAFVKTRDGQVERNYTDNWMSRQTFSFVVTKSLEVWYVLIDYRPTAHDERPNVPDISTVLTKYLFTEMIYPIPDFLDSIHYEYRGTFPYDGPDFVNETGEFDGPATHVMWTAVHQLYENFTHDFGKPDVLGAFYDCDDLGIEGVDHDHNPGHYAGGHNNTFISCYAQAPETMAHEVGHALGGRHPDDDPNWPYHDPDWPGWPEHDPDWPYEDHLEEIPTYGFTTCAVNTREDSGYLDVPIFSALSPSSGDIMSLHRPHWISPYTWDKTMCVLDPQEGLSFSVDVKVEGSSPGLLVTGEIYKNNTGVMNPIFETPSFANLTLPSGPYVVQIRGPPPAESLLYSQSFSVSFSFSADPQYVIGADEAVFSLNLPLMTGAYSVSLWNGTVLLDKITASANPPSVTVTHPSGGEITGDLFNATWTAQDADGDPLTFRLYYSSDNGMRWRPLSPRITGTSYRVDTSMLPGGSQCLIRVLASDGFHTRIDQSNGVFNVPSKDPQNLLAYYQEGIPNESYLNSSRERRSVRSLGGTFTILKGSAFDPEDGMLDDTALKWFSDLDGVLGTGRVLTVTSLMPGVHNITLTATDSDGNNATKSFILNVELPDIVIKNVSATKTVVRQGYTINIDATVENQGVFTASFQVTFLANTTEIETQVMTLASGNTATITSTWNTAGFAKGNYSISAYAWPVDGEPNELVNGWVFVTILGDVNGDRKVDITDISMVIAAYGKRSTSPGWYAPTWYANRDLNGDNKIDITDISLVISQYGYKW